MPRGGARVGAGRKPKQPRANVTPIAPALTVVQGGQADALSAIAPADLPTEQRAIWQAWAPRALEQGTLTPQTEAAFRLLCELEAEKQANRTQIDKDGRTYVKVTVDGAGQEHQELKAHPLTGPYHRLAKQVEALMGRFMLAPFGKPGPGAKKPAAPANPWAGIVAGRK